MDNYVTVILPDGTRLIGEFKDVRKHAQKLGLQMGGLYRSESMGTLIIADMDTTHIGNAISKILRDSQNARWAELTDLFEEYRARAKRQTALED